MPFFATFVQIPAFFYPPLAEPPQSGYNEFMHMEDDRMPSLHQRVTQALQAEGRLLRGQRIVVAVSGGADSVALLCLLCDLATDLGIHLVAAHLEHGIRGAASERDAAFVRELCAELDIPFRMARVQAPRLASLRGKGQEEAARFARHRFLELVRAREDAAYIALAHHRDDQAETLLLHLTRGSGLTGLCGMAQADGVLLRPLLAESPETLRAYLRGRRQGWREDASNRDPKYARNYVRQELLPVLRHLNSNIEETLYRTTLALSDDEAYIMEQLVALPLSGVVPMPYGGCLRMTELSALPPALLRRYLRRTMQNLALPMPEQRHLLAIEALARGAGEALTMNGGITVRRGATHLHFERPGGVWWEDAVIPLRLKGETPLWLGMWLEARPAASGETGDGKRTQVIRREALCGAVVRTRRQGDNFSAFGQSGRRPLKRVLIDRKVDRPFRGFLPLVAAQEDILWICGHLPAAQAARRSPREEAVCLTLRGELPWDE